MTSQADKLLFGVSAFAFFGAGIRLALIFWASCRGQFHPPERAPLALRVYGALTLVGAVGLGLWLWL